MPPKIDLLGSSKEDSKEEKKEAPKVEQIKPSEAPQINLLQVKVPEVAKKDFSSPQFGGNNDDDDDNIPFQHSESKAL